MLLLGQVWVLWPFSYGLLAVNFCGFEICYMVYKNYEGYYLELRFR